ncbi:hypothetical protein [Halostreptopolyspora alba]|uniref:hypothetical protein n=1 Tax=Halostreptopolyspora alba TaxID=2487137 RepID=UPI0026859EA1
MLGAFAGTFPTDLGDVPENAVAYIAELLGIDDPVYTGANHTGSLDHSERYTRQAG